MHAIACSTVWGGRSGFERYKMVGGANGLVTGPCSCAKNAHPRTDMLLSCGQSLRTLQSNTVVGGGNVQFGGV